MPTQKNPVDTAFTFLDEEYSIWFKKLPYSGLVINTTVNVSTGRMPFMLMHRAKAKLPIELAVGTSSNTLS